MSTAANALRLNVQVWVSDERFVLKGRNDATTIARAAAAIRGEVGELLAPYEPFSASRVRAKETKGRVSGFYDIKLVGENRSVVDAGIARLAGIGFHKLAREDEFQEDDCFTIIVPKELCVGPLLADLANLTGVVAVAYETGGGIPGAGYDKARVVLKGSMEAALVKAPAFIRWEDGLVKVLPLQTGAGIQGSAGDGVGVGARVTEGFTVMPGCTAARAGTLKMGVLAIGIERADTNVGRPLRQFFAELFMSAEKDVSFFSLHRKGFADGAFEVTIPDTVENRELKAALVDRCVTGTWKPSSGDDLMQYHDPAPPSLIVTVDRIKLMSAARLFEPEYVDVGERVEAAERKEVMDKLRVQLGAVMEMAAADRAALTAVQAQLRSELLTQSALQTQALKDQSDHTEKAITALQVQTTGIVEVMGQQRELVMAAHSRADSGELTTQATAGAVANLMLRGDRMGERPCLGVGRSAMVGARGAPRMIAKTLLGEVEEVGSSVRENTPGKEAGMEAGTEPQQDTVDESNYETVVGGIEGKAEGEDVGEEEAETRAGDEAELERRLVEEDAILARSGASTPGGRAVAVTSKLLQETRRAARSAERETRTMASPLKERVLQRHSEHASTTGADAQRGAKASKSTAATQDTTSRRVQGQCRVMRSGGAHTCDVTGEEAWWWRRWGTFLLLLLLLCVGGSADWTWAHQKGQEGAIQGSEGALHNESPMMLRIAKYRSTHGLSGLGRAFAGGRSLTRKKRWQLSFAWPLQLGGDTDEGHRVRELVCKVC